MAGYDRKGVKRLLVEAKFWDSLGQQQASGYFGQLEQAGPGVLLFIAPDNRIETLWAEIGRQMENGEESVQLDLVETTERTRRARIVGSDKRVMLVSWDQLLGSMAASVADDTQVACDIQQLRGLARYQDEEAFLPIHPEELGLAFPRRIRGLNRLIDDVVYGRDWILPGGMGIAKDYCGRYFGFPNTEKGALGLFVHFSRWATSGGTPLWLWIHNNVPIDIATLRDKIPSLVGPESWGTDVPIDLKTGVEYESVVDDVVRQVKAIRDMIEAP